MVTTTTKKTYSLDEETGNMHVRVTTIVTMDNGQQMRSHHRYVYDGSDTQHSEPIAPEIKAAWNAPAMELERRKIVSQNSARELAEVTQHIARVEVQPDSPEKTALMTRLQGYQAEVSAEKAAADARIVELEAALGP